MFKWNRWHLKLWSVWFYFTSLCTCYSEQEWSCILTKQAICWKDRALLTAMVTPLRKRWGQSGLAAILGRTHTWPSCSVPCRSTIVSPPPVPPLACTHIAPAPTGPERGYLFYIRHLIVIWHMHDSFSLQEGQSQHIGEQHRERDCNFTDFVAYSSNKSFWS